MDIKQQIKSALAKSGLSQNKLAQLTGVDQSVISRAVRGERSVTSRTLEKLWPYICDQPQQQASGE